MNKILKKWNSRLLSPIWSNASKNNLKKQLSDVNKHLQDKRSLLFENSEVVKQFHGESKELFGIFRNLESLENELFKANGRNEKLRIIDTIIAFCSKNDLKNEARNFRSYRFYLRYNLMIRLLAVAVLFFTLKLIWDRVIRSRFFPLTQANIERPSTRFTDVLVS